MNIKSIINSKIFKVILRIIIVGLVAAVTLHIVIFLFEGKESVNNIHLKEYFIIIVSFNLMSELQIGFDRFIDRFFPIPQKINQRIFSYVGFIAVVFVIVFLFVRNFYSIDLLSSKRIEVFFGFFLSMLFINGVINYIIFKRILKQLVTSERTISAIKQEKLMMSYNSLKDQLNPHYLFNNLTVLGALINSDQKAASSFIEDFADVYRYVLESSEKQLVNLEEEIEFIHAYIDLHKIRLKTGIEVDINIATDCLKKQIAPLTLQLLVENAVKHNIASKDNPLRLNIETKDDKIFVTNNLQRKTSTYSTNMGLKNLSNRYGLLGANISINETEDKFEVAVPLL